MKEYLPIGTVFMKDDSILMYMITGYLYKDNNNKVYDYMTIPFPYGLMSLDVLNYFNHEDIKDIIFLGYKNEKFQKLNERLNNIRENK